MALHTRARTHTKARHGPRWHPWPPVFQFSGALTSAHPLNAVCQAPPLLPALSSSPWSLMPGTSTFVSVPLSSAPGSHTPTVQVSVVPYTQHLRDTNPASCPDLLLSHRQLRRPPTRKHMIPEILPLVPKFPNPVHPLSEMMVILSRFAGAYNMLAEILGHETRKQVIEPGCEPGTCGHHPALPPLAHLSFPSVSLLPPARPCHLSPGEGASAASLLSPLEELLNVGKPPCTFKERC